jgi:hypothetical protein
MKRVIVGVVIAAMLAPNASAAPKSVAVQLGSIYSAPAGSELFQLSGKNAVFVANPIAKSADILVTAIDPSGVQVWQRTIDSGVDEVATAITSDPLGNIWIAGSAALLPVIETVTPLIGIDNPDQVNIDGANTLRTDMNQLALWKLSATGELLATYLLPQTYVPVVTSLSATNSGISIVGSLNSTPFFISSSTSGVFGKVITIGTNKTELSAVARYSDGTSALYGSSAETLSGKKVAGIRDGVLIKVSKAGAITSLVRSSANKASRSWISGDSNQLVSGPVITGKVTESAVTKFTSAFSPTWTFRFPSAGASTSLSANNNSYLAYSSRGSIAGVSGWKPSSPSLLVLTFDSKGLIKAATALPGLVTPISLQYSATRGVVGLASASDGTVSIFTLVSR